MGLSVNHGVLDLSSPDDLKSIRQVIENEPVAFVIGSAVSSFAPSGLPSGQEIVSQVSRYLLRDEHIEQHSERYRRLLEFTKKAAFEHLLEHYPKPHSLKAYFSRAFAKPHFNKFHESIAEISAKIGAPIITTNYDELLERAFQSKGDPYYRIVSKQDVRADNYKFSTIFKIHSCVSEPQSMVLRMSEEGMLKRWKYDLFSDLLRDRTLIVIGYSGQDFEICPAIQTADIKQLYWNVYPYDKQLSGVSANLRHLLKLEQRSFPFTVLAGDMSVLLNVGDPKREWNNSGIQSFFDADLDSEQAAAWRSAFFGSIAAPHAVKRQIEKLPKGERQRAESGYNYRLGKYLSSHKVLYPAGHKHKFDAATNAYRLVDKSFKYRNAGLLAEARKACIDARQEWKALSSNDRNLLADSILWSTVLNLPIDSMGIWEAAAIKLEDIRHKAGDWGGLYNLRIHLKQRDRDDIVSPNRFYKLMDAREGYSHIGNISAYVDEFTRHSYDEICTYGQFVERISVAEMFQLNPNIYKCCYAALSCSNISGISLRFPFFWKCIRYMWKCEYSMRLRAYLMFWITAVFLFSGIRKRIS